MKLTPIKTPVITPRSCTMFELLDTAVTAMEPGSVLAVTSKVVSLCEGRVVPRGLTDKQSLVRQYADRYVVGVESKWGANFTITNDTLISGAGIDESNASGVYVLWPKNPQTTANAIREYLVQRFGHDKLGVVITDSASRPLRRGASGIALAFSGFKPLHNYVGQPDLFDRPYKVSQADIVGGVAAAAVLVMGEGAESTPLVMLEDVTAAEFVPRNPTGEELTALHIALEDDMFAPFLESVTWRAGGEPHTS